MALWDNLSKKASGTTAKAVQQAKDLAETTKLNAMISEEKKKMEAVYSELGKLYAQLHRDDYENAFADMMTSLADSEQKIKDCTEQIQTIKGVIRCPNCGADMPKNSVFCSTCGTAIPKTEPVRVAPAADGPVCANCGAVMAPGMRFCTGCGSPMPTPVPVVEAPPVEKHYDVVIPEPEPAPAPVEEPAAVSGASVCAFCGAAMEDGTVFCTNCGAKVSFEPEEEKTVVYEPPVVEIPAAPAVPTCPGCGAVLEEGTVFCTECGTRVTAPVAEPVFVAPVQPTCPNCGAALEEGTVFCTECGTRI